MRTARSLAMTVALATPALALPPIAEMVTSSEAVLVIESPSVEALVSALTDSAFGRILGDGEPGDLLIRLLGAEDFTIEDLGDRLDFDPDELAWPAGSLGLVIPPPWEDDFSQRVLDAMDAEDGIPPQRLRGSPVLVVDFGGSGEGWREALDAAMDYAADEGWIEFVEGDEVGTVEVFEVRSRLAERRQALLDEVSDQVFEEQRAAGDFDDWDETMAEIDRRVAERLGGSEDEIDRTLAMIFASFETIAWAWSDDTLVLTSEAEVVAELLVGADAGVDRALADAPFYRDSTEAIGAVQARLVVNPSVLFELARDTGGMGGGVVGMIGLDAMEGMAIGLDLRTPDGLAAMPVAMLVPEKRGIFRLFDRELDSFELPAMVPATAQGAYRLSVRFDQVLPLARDIIESLPPEEQQEAQFAFDQAAFIAGPILDQMEPELTVLMFDSVADDPEGFGAMPDLLVLAALRDEAPLLNALSGFGAAAGLAGRPFEGGTIFGMEGPTEFAVGVGHGWAMVGSPVRVENGLRRAAQPGQRGLSDEAEFASAMRLTKNRGLMFSYTSGEETLSALQQLAPLLGLDELGDRLEESLMEDLEDAIGPTITEVQITDRGYAGRLLILEKKD